MSSTVVHVGDVFCEITLKPSVQRGSSLVAAITVRFSFIKIECGLINYD